MAGEYLLPSKFVEQGPALTLFIARREGNAPGKVRGLMSYDEGKNVATSGSIDGSSDLHAAQRKSEAQAGGGSNLRLGGWATLAEAAKVLNISPVILRRQILRHANRTKLGIVARFDGLTARKLGNQWRIHLGPWALKKCDVDSSVLVSTQRNAGVK